MSPDVLTSKYLEPGDVYIIDPAALTLDGEGKKICGGWANAYDEDLNGFAANGMSVLKQVYDACTKAPLLGPPATWIMSADEFSFMENMQAAVLFSELNRHENPSRNRHQRRTKIRKVQVRK